jgi:hypothetical protein
MPVFVMSTDGVWHVSRETSPDIGRGKLVSVNCTKSRKRAWLTGEADSFDELQSKIKRHQDSLEVFPSKNRIPIVICKKCKKISVGP